MGYVVVIQFYRKQSSKKILLFCNFVYLTYCYMLHETRSAFSTRLTFLTWLTLVTLRIIWPFNAGKTWNTLLTLSASGITFLAETFYTILAFDAAFATLTFHTFFRITFWCWRVVNAGNAWDTRCTVYAFLAIITAFAIF